MQKLYTLLTKGLTFLIMFCGFMLLIVNVRANDFINNELAKTINKGNFSMTKSIPEREILLQSETDVDYCLVKM